jgi:hypothetical protein
MPRKPRVLGADPRAWVPRLFPHISSGLSLASAVDELPGPSKPSLSWFKDAIRTNPNLQSQYRQAQEERGDALAERILQISEEPIPAGLSGSEASAWVTRQRLRVEALKWAAAHLKPKSWGEHVSVDLSVEHRISVTAALEAAQNRVETIDAIEPEPAVLLEDSRPRAKRLAAVPSERSKGLKRRGANGRDLGS